MIGNIPSCIKNLEGKDYTVTFYLKDQNLIGGSMVYEACSIFEGYEDVGESIVNIDVEAYTEENINLAVRSCFLFLYLKVLFSYPTICSA